jgi:hypothetical protein
LVGVEDDVGAGVEGDALLETLLMLGRDVVGRTGELTTTSSARRARPLASLRGMG